MVPFPMNLRCLLLFFLVVCFEPGAAFADEKVRRVYDSEEPLGFTDLTFFGEAFYLTFRSGGSEVVVLTSKDMKDWVLAHRFRVEGREPREPQFLVFRERLFVLTETWYGTDPDFNLRLGYAVFTKDGKGWSEPELMEGTFGHALSEAATDGVTAYLIGRRKPSFLPGDSEKLELVKLESDDGLNWRASDGMDRRAQDTSIYAAKVAELTGGAEDSYPALLELSPTRALVAWCSTEKGSWGLQMAEIELSWDRSLFSKNELERIDAADRILAEQRENGGWSKGTEEDDAMRLMFDRRSDDTTLDNGTTHRQIKVLAEAYSKSKLPRFRDGAEAGIQFLLAAQYENGGWPQRYPKMKGYARYITFNDGAMVGALDVLSKAGEKQKPFEWVEDSLSGQARESVARGVDCVLKCQVVRDGVLTVWGQQHDEIDFRPQHARDFEPPSLCSSESEGIVSFLMKLDSPSEAIVESIESAMRWFEGPAKLSKDGKVTWARLYEIETDRPIFGDRDRKVYYDLAEISEERREGYAWYVTSPLKVIEKYPEWRRRLAADVTSER
jgi:PelA/Pel-15E family pectate lyase